MYKRTDLEIEEVTDFLISCISKRWKRSFTEAAYRKVYDKKDWQPSHTRFLSDYRSALKWIRDTLGKRKREEVLPAAISAREEIIAAAWKNGNISLALKGEQDLATLEGLYEKDGQEAVKVIFNIDSQVVASSDDDPVSEEEMTAYKAKVGLDE